uniref:peptide chain release factor N(5)-glutamine methyltransferase n=1 Tax=Amblyomma maculatum TaxID=34609 RepID=G3MNU0_AMBMU
MHGSHLGSQLKVNKIKGAREAAFSVKRRWHPCLSTVLCQRLAQRERETAVMLLTPLLLPKPLSFFCLNIEQIQAHPDSTVSILPSELNKLNDYCWRRAQRLPVQYILGKWSFHGIYLKMCPPVFIPRPETEGLVDIVLSHINRSENEVGHVLDIGCGTGAICLTLASRTSKVHYTAIDKSPMSVRLTEENSSQLGLRERVSCYLAEATPNGLKCSEPDLNRSIYDAIVSNPPYIAIQESNTIEPEVLKHEDHTALFAGFDGLDVVRSILRMSRRLLRVGGHIFLEVGLLHPPLIRAMLAAQEHSHLFKLVAVHPDFTSRPRFVE